MNEKPKYKIAICLSGELRTYKDCLENISKFFNRISHPDFDIELDYFIHTWDKNDYKPQYKKTKNISNAVLDIDYIKSYINLVNYKQETGGKIEMIGWKSMFYSIQYCNLLKQNYEVENNFTYDMVIRTRFDIFFNFDFNFYIHPMYEQTVYTTSGIARFSDELNCFNFDDVFFYGTSSTMNIMSNIYSFIDKNITIERYSIGEQTSQLSNLFNIGPGGLLYYYMRLYGINYDKQNKCYYSVYRFYEIPKFWNTIDNYNEISNFMVGRYLNKII